MAPEILNARSEKPDITKQDIWALGVTAYKICTFSLPFLEESIDLTIVAILQKQQKPISHPDLSDEIKAFIDSLLIKDPQQRPDLEKIMQNPLIRKAIIDLASELKNKEYFDLRRYLIERDASFQTDLARPTEWIESTIANAILHTKELPCSFSQVCLPIESQENPVSFVQICKDRLYTSVSSKIFVYSLTSSDLKTPMKTYFYED